MRVQLIRPNNDFVSPQIFNRMFTMHGTTMIFFVAMPLIFGFATYLIPLMIGARDMALPRLNAFSFWITVRQSDGIHLERNRLFAGGVRYIYSSPYCRATCFRRFSLFAAVLSMQRMHLVLS